MESGFGEATAAGDPGGLLPCPPDANRKQLKILWVMNGPPVSIEIARQCREPEANSRASGAESTGRRRRAARAARSDQNRGRRSAGMLPEFTMTVHPRFTDSELMEHADRLDMNLEVSRDGTIRMMARAGYRSSTANAEILRQLANWRHTHGQGRVSDADTLFTLPDGAKLGPDAAYISPSRLRELPAGALEGFAAVVPNLVIELLSEVSPARRPWTRCLTGCETELKLAGSSIPVSVRCASSLQPGKAAAQPSGWRQPVPSPDSRSISRRSGEPSNNRLPGGHPKTRPWGRPALTAQNPHRASELPIDYLGSPCMELLRERPRCRG